MSDVWENIKHVTSEEIEVDVYFWVLLSQGQCEGKILHERSYMRSHTSYHLHPTMYVADEDKGPFVACSLVKRSIIL